MESVSRRKFVGAAMAGMAAWTAKAPGQTVGPATPPGFRQPFVYRFKIGELEAFSISDCDLALNEGLGLMWSMLIIICLQRKQPLLLSIMECPDAQRVR